MRDKLIYAVQVWRDWGVWGQESRGDKGEKARGWDACVVHGDQCVIMMLNDHSRPLLKAGPAQQGSRWTSAGSFCRSRSQALNVALRQAGSRAPGRGQWVEAQVVPAREQRRVTRLGGGEAFSVPPGKCGPQGVGRGGI